MMAYVAPQQFMWNISRSAPPGWSGPWPPVAPVGYPGPPPVPSGIDVNAWKGGQWQVNPMYVPAAVPAPAAPAQAWAPHPSWGVAQAGPSFNPYKRIANPGDANYFATDLLENPLGLENMIPREELEKRVERHEARLAAGETPMTPWLWAPKELSKSDEHHDHPPDTRDGRGARDLQDRHEARERHNSTQASSASASASHRHPQRQQTSQQTDSTSHQAAQQYPQFPTTQQPSQYDPSSISRARRERRPESHATAVEPTPPSSAPATVSSYAQLQRQAQSSQSQTLHRSQSQHRPQRASSQQPETQRSEQQPQHPKYRHQTEPPRTPTHVSSASAQVRSMTYDETRSEAFSSREKLKPTFSPNIVRTPMHYTGHSSASAAANGSTPTRYGASDDSRDDLDLSRRLAREESVPRSSPARRDSTRQSGRNGSRSRHRDNRDREQDSDDESPSRRSYVRGPIYAPSTPTPGASRSSSAAPSRASTSPNGHMSSAPSLTSSMSTLSIDTPPVSASSNQSLFLTTFTDEPAGVLSPLVVANQVPSKASPRDLSRNQTYPLLQSNSQSGSYPSIPEEKSSTPHPPPISRTPSKTPRPSPSQPSPKHIRTPSSIGRSRTYPMLSSDPFAGEPPVIPPMPSPVRPSSRAPTPPRSSGRSPSSWNPLPQPPMPVNYPMSSASAAISSSASASASASAASQQAYQRSRTQSQYSSPQSHNHHSPSHATHGPPPQYSSASAAAAAATAAASRHVYGSSATISSTYPPSSSHGQYAAASPARQRKVRYGFWNRRGDHLTLVTSSDGQMKQYIVYAPRSLANPEELSHYPTPTEGWKDHHGDFRRYDPSVPELPESLPSHGEPPVKPYESFVRFTYV